MKFQLSVTLLCWCMMLAIQAQDTGLHFTLRDTAYQHGDSALITDIGQFTYPSLEGAASSLVCNTSSINYNCCRTIDGGNVGEWFFPNGTMVPRNRGNFDADFTRSGFTHQIRLNRRNNALMPIGEYTCSVPDENNETLYSATLMLILVTISIPATFNASEDDGMILVCATLSITPTTAVTNRAINVLLATSGQTTNLDYIPVSMDFMLPAGIRDGTLLCLNVSIVDDAYGLEGDETFTVTLTALDHIHIPETTMVITIRDNEHVNVSIPAIKSVNEDGRSLEVCATLSGKFEITENDLRVILTASSLTTTMSDFVCNSQVLIFPAGSTNITTKCLAITIIDDDMLEGNEIFTITWRTPNANVTLLNNETTVTIIDNEDTNECFTMINTCTVATPLISLSVSPGPLVAGRLKDVILNCSAWLNLDVFTRGTIHYAFTWEDSNNGTIMSEQHTIISSIPSLPYSTLTFSPISTEDTNITCTVTVLETSSALQNSMPVMSFIMLNVTTPDDPLVEILSAGNSTAGALFTLTCTVTLLQLLSEMPTFVWVGPYGTQIENETLTDVTVSQLSSHTGVLTFSPLHTDYGGEYLCRASVDIPEAGVAITNSSTSNIIVQIPSPSITITGFPVDSDFFTGLRLIFTCSILIPQQLHSQPVVVTAHWTKAGFTLENNTRVTVGVVDKVGPLLYESTVVFSSLDGSRDSGEYTCTGSINASTSATSYNITVPTLFFQLKISQISADCQSWRLDDTSAKDSDLVEALVQNVVNRCGCDFREDRLTDRVFLCFPSSPQSVTYYAQLHGTLNANVSELFMAIKDWVSTGITIPVQFLPVRISNVSIVSPRTTSSTTEEFEVTSGSNYILIIGVCAGVCVALAVVAAIVVVIAFTRCQHFKLARQSLTTPVEGTELNLKPFQAPSQNTYYDDIMETEKIDATKCPAYQKSQEYSYEGSKDEKSGYVNILQDNESDYAVVP